MRFLVYCTLTVLFLACKPRQGEKNVAKAEIERPNILWITCEDISPTLSIYGDSTALTPNLDALASESLVYEKAYSGIDIINYLDKYHYIEDNIKKYQYLLTFNRIKLEINNEKLLIMFLLNFIFLRSDINLENISFM